MKKLFTFVALAASMFCASASVTDTFTAAYLGELAHPSDTWIALNGTYRSEASGAEYTLTNVYWYGDHKYTNSTGKVSTISVAAPAGIIEAVTICAYANADIYLSETELTQSNYTDGYKVDKSDNYFNDPINVADKGYKYALILITDDITDYAPAITWGEDNGGGGETPEPEPEPEPAESSTDSFSAPFLKTLGLNALEWNTGTYTSPVSGAEYYINALYLGSDYASPSPDGGSYIAVVKPAGIIESVNIFPMFEDHDIYLSTTELTASNYETGDLIDKSDNWGYEPINVADKGYKYAYIKLDTDDLGEDLYPQITWSGDNGGDTPEPEPVVSSTDVITAADLLEANPDANVMHFDGSVPNYDGDWTFGNNLTLDGESGATYTFTNIGICDTQYRFAWNYDLSSNLAGYNAEKWIESVEIKFGNSSQQDVKFYASNAEFAASARNDADFKYTEYTYENPLVINVNVPCHYFMMTVSQGNVESITINWTDEKPVPTVETPVIDCWDNPVQVGSRVSINTKTLGATIHATVFVNDELAETQPEPYLQDNEYSSMSITLPGKAGDKVRIEAYATKDEWVDSATADWECESLAMAPAPNPMFFVGEDRYPRYVFNGTEVTVRVANYDNETGEYTDIEGAEVSIAYSWNNWDTYESGSADFGEWVAAPATFVIPDDVPAGSSFQLEAKSQAPGYRESEWPASNYYSIVSKTLDAPRFSCEDGDVVKAGGSLTIYRAENATEIHYTVNGGEEQVSTEWSVSIPVTEATTVEAWSTGNDPFEPSEKVTVTVAPEHFEAWQDVITPSTFGMAGSQDYSLKVYPSVLTNETTGVEYEYRGGFYDTYIDGEDVSTFYMNGSNYLDFPYVRNTTTAVNAAPIKTIQIESYSSKSFFVFLSKSPIETITNEMSDSGYAGEDPIRVTVANEGELGSDFADNYELRLNKTIDLDQLQDFAGDDEFVYNDNTYIAIAPVQASQSYRLVRAIIGYDKDQLTGVESVTVDSLNGVEAVYNLNGVKVDADKLNSGVYVRVANGKATKVIIK